MVTENVTVAFRETGTRVIIRQIDKIGLAANRATRGIFLLQRALFVLGGAGIIRGLAAQADALTNIENRLKLTTTSSQNLEAVQGELFEIAKRSRSSFQAVSEIYSRTALSSRELGISQRETAKFTESLAKATIISGASAREANAAIIQLSQGMASNRLSGDEMRSVLEQLPFVADVIAKEMGITRGELREFGREGKVAAKQVLDAFKNQADEIDRLFSQLVPTIGQAIVYLETSWLQFLDSFEDATGASNKVAAAIIKIADNIDILVTAALVAASSLAGMFVTKQLSKYIGLLRVAGVRMGRFNAIARLRAAHAVKLNQAMVASNTLQAANIRQSYSEALANKLLLTEQLAYLRAEERAIKNKESNVRQSRKLNEVRRESTRVSKLLNANDAILLSNASALASLRQRQATDVNKLATANRNLAAASAANATLTARLTRWFPVLAGAVATVAAGFTFLWGVLAAHPIGAIITAVGALTIALLTMGNRIKVTEDGVVGLRDAAIAAFQIITETVGRFEITLTDKGKAAVQLFGESFLILPRIVTDVFTSILSTVKSIINTTAGIVIGLILGLEAAWDDFPAAVEYAAKTAANKLIKWMAAGIDKVIGLLNRIPHVNIPQIGEAFQFELSEAGGKAGEKFQKAFNFAQQDYVGAVGDAITGTVNKATDAIINRARENIAAASGSLTEGERDPNAGATDGDGGKGKKGRDVPTFQEKIAELQQEIQLLRLRNKEREIAQGLLDIEDDIERKLTKTEEALAESYLRTVQAMDRQADLLEEIKGPMEELIQKQWDLNVLHGQGKITLEEYIEQMRMLRIEMAETSNTFEGGFIAAMLRTQKTAKELGTEVGNNLISAVDSAADAIVNFASTGETNVRQFAINFLQWIARTIIRALLLKAIMTALGIPTAPGGVPAGGSGAGGVPEMNSFGKALFGGLASLIQFQHGGSILPSGTGTRDTQLVQFMKRPDERVDVLTPAQQSQRDGEGSGSGDKIKIVNVLDPSIVGNYMRTAAGERLVLNIVEKNRA